ncbi:MAG TPA: hypothetical protein DCY13_14855 [Verrucomicrobiales bacterium]|nr:hypothetical protein [Verrucomicrobiales bacterium]
MTDRELLDQVARQRSEDAFNEIVRRRVDLVYSAALRQLGNADQARDVAQNVFIRLAQQMDRLQPGVILTGWLYRTTRNLCLETLRSERRRREREQAAAEQLMNLPATTDWNQVAPALEPAMDELSEADRDAVLLRYFENKSLREVGTTLGIGEDAAQKRVSRALERLREIFAKRGVTLSAAALATTISGGAVQAVPAAMVTTISSAALGAGLAATTILNTTSTMTTLLNLKTAAAVLTAAAVTGTSTYLVKDREVDRLRSREIALNEFQASLTTDQNQALAAIQLRDRQIESLKKEVAELPRLRGEVDRLNRELERLAGIQVERDHAKQALAELQDELRHVGHRAAQDDQALQKNLEEQRAVRRMTELRQLGLALAMHAGSNSGWFPTRQEFAALLAGSNDSGSGVELSWSELRPENLELVFQGHSDDIADAARTIVVRQADVGVSGDGQKIHRTYGFADGHTEVHSAANLEELLAWESERIVPPDLQSRRPR